MLNVPRHKITVRVKRSGGAFGGKARIQCAYLAAAAAAKFGAPVRLALDRRVDMEITGHRHEVIAGSRWSPCLYWKLETSAFLKTLS